MSVQYFEDIKLNEKSRSREYHLNETEIIDFAKNWDPSPFHIDPEYAKNTKFGGLFAAAIHLLAIGIKLANEQRCRPALITGLGWDEIRFVSPARPGDVLVLEREADSKQDSRSYPKAGIVRFVSRLINQFGEPVLTFKSTMLVEKRPEV